MALPPPAKRREPAERRAPRRMPAARPVPAGQVVEHLLPLPVVHPALVPRAAEHLRRCTFRRLSVATPARRGVAVSYQVECLYAGSEAPLALGDLDAARRICDPCGNPGIFRADED